MTAADTAVVIGGLALTAGLVQYFFAPGKATHAWVQGGRQVVGITVRAAARRN
jgi:Cu+-exporting ATPase